MNFYIPLIKTVESAYMPLALSSLRHYFFPKQNYVGEIFQEKISSPHLKAAKVFTASTASSYLCAPLKLNFIANTACSFIVKEVASYGIESLYGIELNTQSDELPELYNDPTKLFLQE